MTAWSRATREKGVIVNEGCRLDGFETRNGQVTGARTGLGRFTADQFILAAGAWTPALGRQLGLRVPVQPGKGYSLTMDRLSAGPPDTVLFLRKQCGGHPPGKAASA